MFPIVFLIACDSNGRDRPAERAHRAARISVALRGVRPTLAELERIEGDADEIEDLVDDWLADPRFGSTVRNFHDETWGLRSDYSPVPASGSLSGVELGRIKESLVEAPLRLAEQIVMEDRPYTEIVTADRAYANKIVSQAWVGIEGYPPSETGWHEVRWGDGRPAAGILSDSWLWVVYRSAGANYSRGRAAVTLRAAVCSDLFTEDVPITDGSIDLSDPDVVADALREEPRCATCHDLLDPVAAIFPFREYFVLQETDFPIPMMADHEPDRWKETVGVPPAYKGEPMPSLSHLGRAIASDPAFARCTARRWSAYLNQQPISEVDGTVVAALADGFTASGFSVRTLVRNIVMSDDFARPAAAEDGRLHKLRPEALSRVLADLTGFVWEEDVRSPCCGAPAGESPLGNVDLLRDAHHGYRVLAGGTDFPFQDTPVHTATPTFALVLSSVAARAASHAVALAASGELGLVDPERVRGGSDEQLRTEFARIRHRVLSVPTDPDDPAVGELLALYRRIELDRGPLRGWTVVLAALLQDPQAVLY